MTRSTTSSADKTLRTTLHPIHVVSLGCGDYRGLSTAACTVLQEAEVIIGAQHHFTEIAPLHCKAKTFLIPSPFSGLNSLLQSNQQHKMVILASGDALFFGIGSWLINTLGKTALVFHPNVSSLQTAFHRVGLPWQDAVIHSLHGRPLSTLRLHLANKQLIGLFTDAKSNPVAIAQLLCESGFAESTLHICEALGSTEEKVSSLDAQTLSQQADNFHPLTVCIIECVGHNKALTAFPGIPDEHFSTGAEAGKGMISKREVRLAILSLMQPSPQEVAWDIGAGCGSVSVEWARSNPTGQIYAIEHHADRIEHLLINNERFGTRLNLTPIQGTAPQCCAQLPSPDAIFIGGSDGELAMMLDYAWQQLEAGGKLVASAVTEESRQALNHFAQQFSHCEGDVVNLQISKTSDLTQTSSLRELKAVLLLKLVKPRELH